MALSKKKKKEAQELVNGALGFTLYSIMAVSTAETLPPSKRAPGTGTLQGLLQTTALFSFAGALALGSRALDIYRQR
tara:strand:+ start:681 stop:911 length:231 start_codon:yes stop_codon:yes gene_type:complete